MIDSQTKTAIVLSGGGARGAFEAGVLSGLQDRVSFDIVCGTSIGSINAALTAQRAFDELAQLWQTISTLKVVRYIDVVQKVNAFVDDVEGLRGKPLAALGNFHLVNDWCKIGSKKGLLSLRGIYDEEPIQGLLTTILNVNAIKSTLILTATNLTNGTSDAFYHFENADEATLDRFLKSRLPDPSYDMEKVNYVNVVRASAAIPGAFQPVKMNLGKPGADFEYVDGGVANNTPVNLAVSAGATHIYVVFMDPAGLLGTVEPTTNLYEIGLACLTVMQQKIMETDLRAAKDTDGVTFTEIRPDQPLSVGVLGFNDRAGLEAAYAQGVAVAQKV